MPARINIARAVRELVYGARRARDVVDGIKRLHRRHRIRLDLLWTHLLHAASTKDDLKLVEYVHNRLGRARLSAVVDRVLGRHSYTPLCRAAYNGSVRMMKFLVACGANVRFKNAHNEDIRSCIAEGLRQQLAKYVDNAIFIEQRFEECARFLDQRILYLERRRAAPARGPIFVPRCVRRDNAARAIQKAVRERRARLRGGA